MEVNTAHPGFWSSTISTATDAQSDITRELRSVSRQSCCSVAQCKADVETLISTFKEDLNRIVLNNFGSPPTPASTAMTVPADVKPISVHPPSPISSSLCSLFSPSYKRCMSCAKAFEGQLVPRSFYLDIDILLQALGSTVISVLPLLWYVVLFYCETFCVQQTQLPSVLVASIRLGQPVIALSMTPVTTSDFPPLLHMILLLLYRSPLSLILWVYTLMLSAMRATRASTG
jgi:hypothetical protein